MVLVYLIDVRQRLGRQHHGHLKDEHLHQKSKRAIVNLNTTTVHASPPIAIAHLLRLELGERLHVERARPLELHPLRQADGVGLWAMWWSIRNIG